MGGYAVATVTQVALLTRRDVVRVATATRARRDGAAHEDVGGTEVGPLDAKLGVVEVLLRAGGVQPDGRHREVLGRIGGEHRARRTPAAAEVTIILPYEVGHIRGGHLEHMA